MEKFTGIAKDFYPEVDDDGIIRFALLRDIPADRKVELVVHDVATGTRRGNLIISGMSEGSGWWWAPSPGNHTESRKNLGDIILSVVVDENTEREFYLDRGGPGKKIEISGTEIRYPKIKDNLYPTFWEIFIAGEYFGVDDTEKNGVIIDIGSNYGLFSIYAMEKYSPRRIVAVEPNYSCFTTSSDLLSGFQQFEVLNLAITEKTGRYSLEIENEISAVGKIIEKEDGEIVGVDINTLMDRVGEDRIDLMKIDCEGGELGIFQTITDPNMSKIDRFVIEYHSEEIYRTISEIITKSGFEIENIKTAFESSEIGILIAKRKQNWNQEY